MAGEMGLVGARGTITEPSLIATAAATSVATGTLTLSTISATSGSGGGTVTLKLTGAMVKGSGPLPLKMSYTITGGTGQFAGATGVGTIGITVFARECVCAGSDFVDSAGGVRRVGGAIAGISADGCESVGFLFALRQRGGTRTGRLVLVGAEPVGSVGYATSTESDEYYVACDACGGGAAAGDHARVRPTVLWFTGLSGSGKSTVAMKRWRRR